MTDFEALNPNPFKYDREDTNRKARLLSLSAAAAIFGSAALMKHEELRRKNLKFLNALTNNVPGMRKLKDALRGFGGIHAMGVTNPNLFGQLTLEDISHVTNQSGHIRSTMDQIETLKRRTDRIVSDQMKIIDNMTESFDREMKSFIHERGKILSESVTHAKATEQHQIQIAQRTDRMGEAYNKVVGRVKEQLSEYKDRVTELPIDVEARQYVIRKFHNRFKLSDFDEIDILPHDAVEAYKNKLADIYTRERVINDRLRDQNMKFVNRTRFFGFLLHPLEEGKRFEESVNIFNEAAEELDDVLIDMKGAFTAVKSRSRTIKSGPVFRMSGEKLKEKVEKLTKTNVRTPESLDDMLGAPKNFRDYLKQVKKNRAWLPIFRSIRNKSQKVNKMYQAMQAPKDTIFPMLSVLYDKAGKGGAHITKVEMIGTDYERGSEIKFRVHFRSKTNVTGQQHMIEMPLSILKWGYYQTDPSTKQIWNLDRFNMGLEASQVAEYSNGMERFFSKILKSEHDPNSLNEAKSYVNRHIQARHKSVTRKGERATDRPLEDELIKLKFSPISEGTTNPRQIAEFKNLTSKYLSGVPADIKDLLVFGTNFVSSGQIQRDVSSFVDPNQLVVGYGSRAQQRALQQLAQAEPMGRGGAMTISERIEKLRRTSSRVRNDYAYKTPVISMQGTEPLWDVLSDYHTNLNALSLLYEETYDSASIIAEEALASRQQSGRVSVYKIRDPKKYKVKGQDVKIWKKGDVIRASGHVNKTGGEVLGRGLFGIVQYIGKQNAVVSDVWEEGGTMYIRTVMDPPPPMHTIFVNTFGKQLVSKTVRQSALPNDINYIFAPEPGAKGDLGGVVETLFGRLSAWAGTNPDRKLELKRAIDANFNGQIITSEVDGIVSFRLPGRTEMSPPWMKSTKFLQKLGKTYRSIRSGNVTGILQSRFNDAILEPWRYKGMYIRPYGINPVTGEYTNGAVRDVFRFIFESVQHDQPWAMAYEELIDRSKFKQQTGYKSFMKFMNTRGELLLKKSDRAATDKMRQALDLIPGIHQPYEILRGFANEKRIGIHHIMSTVQVSDVATFGSGKSVKINEVVLDALKDQVGASAIYESLKMELDHQVARRMGGLYFMAQLGMSGNRPPAAWMNYLDEINAVSQSKRSQQIKEAFDKLMTKQPSDMGKALQDKIKNLTLYEYEGSIYKAPPKGIPLEEVRKLTRKEVLGRTVSQEYYDLLRLLGTGYIELPKEIQRQWIPGTGQQGRLPYAIFEDPSRNLVPIDLEGERVYVADQRALYIPKMLKFLSEKDHSSLQGEIEQMLLLDVKQDVNRNNWARMKFSVTGMVQKGQVITADTLASIRKGLRLKEAGKMVRPFDVVYNATWAQKNEGLIRKFAERLDDTTLDSVLDYATRHDDAIRGVFGGKRSLHPRLIGKMDKIKGMPLTGHGLLEQLQNRHLNKMAKDVKTDLYSQAVLGGILPLPSVFFRQPTYNPSTVTMGFTWFEKMRQYGNDVLVSPLIAKRIGADFDTDTLNILMAHKGFREYYTNQLMNGPYKKDMGVMFFKGYDAEGSGLIWDAKMHDFRVPKSKEEVGKLLDKEIEQMTSGDIAEAFTSGYHKQAQETMRRMRQYIKKSAGKVGMITTTSRAVMEKLGITQAQDRLDLYSMIGGLPEWSVKQKGRGLSENPMDFILQGLSDPKQGSRFVSEMNKVISMHEKLKDKEARKLIPKDSRFFTFEGTKAIMDQYYEPVDQIKYQARADETGIGGFFGQNLYDKNPVVAEKIATKLRKDPKKVTLFDFFVAGHKVHKGAWVYGAQGYFSKSKTYRDVIISASRGEYLQRSLGGIGNFVEDSLVRPFNIDSGAIKTIKDQFKREFSEKLVSQMRWSGKAAVGALGVYFAVNFFRPDQMKGLGEMPGFGGEMWDYQPSTNQFRRYKQYMQVGLGNPYDLPKVYLDLFGPDKSAVDIRRNSRDRFIATPTSFSPFEREHLTRSTYMTNGMPRIR